MPFCYSPWTNVDISPMGGITPCCKFRVNNKFNIQNNTLEEYSNSDMVQKIKQQFLNDQWPDECERCRIEEEHGIQSKRILDFDRWKDYYTQVDLDSAKFLTASVAFGNTCNLTCITCGAHSSSRWQKEHQHIHGIDIKPFHFYKKNFVQDFVSQAPNIIHLDIPGGEPFLSGVAEQHQLLKHYIDTDQAQHITIHYTTNAMIYPSTEWWNLWKHFKEIDMQLSIDGVGARYEYIRHPAQWNTLVNNTVEYIKQQQQLDNFRLSVSHTVSAYNIYYLQEFFDWCANIGLPTPWLGRVHDPVYMQPTVWSTPAREVIHSKLTESCNVDIQPWAELIKNSPESDQFELFCARLKQHDQFRGTSFDTVFPELSKWLQ